VRPLHHGHLDVKLRFASDHVELRLTAIHAEA
jgi:hypothetical protein